MRRSVLLLFALQVVLTAFKSKAVGLLTGLLVILFLYAGYSGFTAYRQQTASRLQYQKLVRANWEKMPDKNPHRMAHYGYIAFRARQPLSVFDFGMESYTGNAVFLEAHRQNTVNFSEAGFSTGLLRFGEISMAMILQMVLPLVVFFIGFNTVAADRENGTLKILLSQGASWKEIIFGKAAGLLVLTLCVLLPVILALSTGCLFIQKGGLTSDTLLRILWIALSYTTYFVGVSLLAVIISSVSRTARLSLVSLIGIWLLFAVILPRTTQAVGNSLYPSPSKVEFESAIDAALLKKGDSHNPDDPYYKKLKDSILKAYGADSIAQLPINYSGFQMKEGERISSEIYNQQLSRLLETYQKQNNVSRLSAFVNPFASLRNFSMAISGTDFNSYAGFQKQTEDYRYRLTQHMNELQIKLISNKKPADGSRADAISREYWKAFPDFSCQNIPQKAVIKAERLSLFALVYWLLLLAGLVNVLSKKLKPL